MSNFSPSPPYSPRTSEVCGICQKIINKNHRAIQCSLCKNWIHLKCNKLDKNDFEFFQNHIQEEFYCIACIANNVPFSKLNNNEFSLLVNKGILRTMEKDIDFDPSSYQQAVFDRLNSEINNNAFDLDADVNEGNNDVYPTIDCKYYSIDQFISEKLHPSRTFSILHFNIHSVERHIEEFRVVLEMMNFKFDIICLSK